MKKEKEDRRWDVGLFCVIGFLMLCSFDFLSYGAYEYPKEELMEYIGIYWGFTAIIFIFGNVWLPLVLKIRKLIKMESSLCVFLLLVGWVIFFIAVVWQYGFKFDEEGFISEHRRHIFYYIGLSISFGISSLVLLIDEMKAHPVSVAEEGDEHTQSGNIS